MHLTRMRLGGVPPFTEPVEFEFDERVNVFVGPNASGKSRALFEINLAFDRESWNGTISHRIMEGMLPPAIGTTLTSNKILNILRISKSIL